jgi:hypothetical protein
MSFSYDPSKLKTSPVYQVRLKIGQTNEYSPVAVQDEEISYLLEVNKNDVNQTCIDLLNSQISQAASFVDKQTGQVSEAQSQILKNLKILRDDLINSISRNVPTFMGITGIFNEDMDTVDNDTEIYQDGVKLKDKGPSKLLFGDDTGVS